MPFVKVKSLKFVEFTISKGICLWILEQTSHIDIKGIFCLQSLFKVSSGSIQHQRTKVLFLMLFHTMFNDFSVFIIKKIISLQNCKVFEYSKNYYYLTTNGILHIFMCFHGLSFKKTYLIIFRIIFQPTVRAPLLTAH